jgi:hypothetical protein
MLVANHWSGVEFLPLNTLRGFVRQVSDAEVRPLRTPLLLVSNGVFRMDFGLLPKEGLVESLDMNRRKIALTTLFCLVLFGSVASAAYVHSTVVFYRHNAPCSKLTGVPAMLLAAHFFDSAQCKLSASGPHAPCQDEAACHVPGTSGDAKNGKCTVVSNQCVCAPRD